jgi:hypothetical protein
MLSTTVSQTSKTRPETPRYWMISRGADPVDD